MMNTGRVSARRALPADEGIEMNLAQDWLSHSMSPAVKKRPISSISAIDEGKKSFI